MLELKFAICYRAASLHSQASYAVLAEESLAFFEHSAHQPRPYLAIGQGGQLPPPPGKLASEYNKILFVRSS